MVPSGRMTLFGGRIKNEEAIPKMMMTKNACDPRGEHTHDTDPGPSPGEEGVKESALTM